VNVISTALEGVLVIEPKVFRDDRGFFAETYHADRYAEAGIDVGFVQDNHSRSVQWTLRGLHAQLRRPQAKLVRVLQGAILDVAVDIRQGSPTFRKWVSAELTSESFRQMYIPAGFAHGFCVLSETAEVEYKCSDLYDPSAELRLLWNDPEIGVAWPTSAPLLSQKDKDSLPLSAWMDQLPIYVEKAA